MAAEISALAMRNVQPRIAPVLCPIFRQSRCFNEKIESLLSESKATLIDPCQTHHTRLALVHHPALFENLPPQPIKLQADVVVLILHHPPFNGFGVPEYDLTCVVENLLDCFASKLLLAPVGPLVREQLVDFSMPGVDICEQDWSNVIDFNDWPVRATSTNQKQVVIGRHSRPQLSKFPETLEQALMVYPDSNRYKVHMLGAPPELAEHYGSVPANWHVDEFDAKPVTRFLAELDYFVYFHSPEWVEAFGYCILEAIASGVPVVTSHDIAKTFGPAVIAAEPHDVLRVLSTLQRDPAAREAHCIQAREWANTHFGLEAFTNRLDVLFPDWHESVQSCDHLPSYPALRPRRYVMMTSNGTGIGHLTRTMAVANRLPEGSEVAIFTLSQGFSLAVDAGFLTQFVPFHGVTGAAHDVWNKAVQEELSDFLDLVQPDCFIFDGNVPYGGVLTALENRPEIKRIWMRRALWSAVNASVLKRAAMFDWIIEPTELCARFDTGATNDANDGAVPVAPIMLTPSEERLSKTDARAELGLEQSGTIVGIMLGAGNNFDLNRIKYRVIEELASHPEVTVVEIESPIRVDQPATSFEQFSLLESDHKRVTCFPVARISNAFDFMVSGAGYNSFHENMLNGVPTIYIPNEAPEMDRQSLRAKYATVIGCAEMLRAGDSINVRNTIQRMLDPAHRESLRARMSKLNYSDGAAEAAHLLTQFATCTRSVRALLSD